MTVADAPLLLAAGGRSRRMGTPKHLLDFHGVPWLRWQLERFLAAGGRRACIVLPQEHLEVDRESCSVPGLETVLLAQSDPAAPMASSLRLAARHACGASAAAAWWLPVDTPAPGKQLWAELLVALEDGDHVAAVPSGGGHPVLLARPLLETLAAGSGEGLRLDETLRSLEAVGRLARGRFVDPLCPLNLNTPGAWEEWLSRAAKLLEAGDARP